MIAPQNQFYAPLLRKALEASAADYARNAGLTIEDARNAVMRNCLHVWAPAGTA